MKSDLKDLEDKLKNLDQKIADVSKRMPAHSVKPPIMTERFELEDERDALEKQIIDSDQSFVSFWSLQKAHSICKRKYEFKVVCMLRLWQSISSLKQI